MRNRWPSRWAAAALIALMAVAGRGADAHSGDLSAEDTRAAKAAFKALGAERWRKARRAAKRLDDPVARKIIHWLDLTDPGTKFPFAVLQRFIAGNPGWPGQTILRRRAEEAMTLKMPHQDVLDWFAQHEPISTEGWTLYALALRGTGEKESARAVLRRTWIDGTFTKRQQKDFYRLYRQHLSADDHARRLDRLIWDGQYWAARRMLWKVKPDLRALAEARLMLMRRRGNVDAAIARVPADLRDHPGLIYERLRWRRRKGKDMAARMLLSPAPADLVRPEKWWTERAILARRALDKGHVSEAYRLAKDHRLLDGGGFAEGEWMAGWIALRFLEEPRVALDHFSAMYESVKFPISRARAAYWAGRAAEALGRRQEAGDWFATAARFTTRYYGQLAAARLDPLGPPRRVPATAADAAEAESFAGHELARVALILGHLGEKDRLDPFIHRLSADRDSAAWKALTATLAESLGRPDLAVAVAKQANREGYQMAEAGYPTLEPPAGRDGQPLVEAALVLAMVRQESAFYPGAKSRAGARGLMQLMPATARKIARLTKTPYSRRRLISDARYNLKLGQAYVAHLFDFFSGSYVLSLAAYNAGPGRVRKWIRANGDPRDDSVDPIDWVEMIPFTETRNYVQRVLENLQLYRLRLSRNTVVMNLEGDLRR